jgi:predicted phage baseplate assembly protein
MSIGRDQRRPSVTMRPAPVLGGLEPELLTQSRQEVEEMADRRAAAYVPEWTRRGPDDAGVAIIKVHVTLAETVHRRLNRLPQRLALGYLRAAGVHALAGTPAEAMGAIEIVDGVAGPVEVPEGSVFSTPSGSVLETGSGCSSLPGRLAALAVLADGWLALDPLKPPYRLQPFGVHPRPAAELWLGLETSVNPAGTVCFAVDLLPPPRRASADSAANQDAGAPPMLRWEAMTSAGAAELALDFDETRGLQRAGVVGFRVPELDWPPQLRPGQTTGTPYRWLRARLVTASFPADTQLGQIVLNGVAASAARSVRGEVAEPLDRSATGSRYRLALVPVVPGSVELDITGSAELGAPESTSSWKEVPSLAAAQPDDQVFVLDASAGLLTFGDGLHGRAVPEGYRNVLARVYRTGGGTAGLPVTGDLLPPEISVPDLSGLRVTSISTGSDGESAGSLQRRGPAVIRSRERAVAAADYAAAALATPGVNVARAYCLPGVDPAGSGANSPGSLGVVVVPRVAARSQQPVPDSVTLQIVAEHLALEAGVVGARVVAVAPGYRRVAVQCLLVGAVGADLARLVSTARDRIDRWLDPLVGGDGSGWEFGAPVRWNALVRMLLETVPQLEAISQVTFRVDGRRRPACTDVELAAGELVWPATHLLEVAPTARGGAS